MSARERFKREYGIKSDYDLAMLGLVLEEHAHELAERQRQWARDTFPNTPTGLSMRRIIAEVADLIHPEVTGGEH